MPLVELIAVNEAWPAAAVTFPEPYVYWPTEADTAVVSLDSHSAGRPVILPPVVLNDIPGATIWASGEIEARSGAVLVESGKRLAHLADAIHPGRRPTAITAADGLGSTIVAPRRLDNYFHWLVDMLPRLYALDAAGDAVELVFPTNIPRFADELLARVLPGRFGVRRIAPGTAVRYDAVRCSPFTTVWAKGLLRPEIAAWLRPRLLGRPLGRSGPGTRLYVSRSTTRWHRVANEEPLLRALAPLGFETIRPEHLPVAQQLERFAEAEVLVGAHGAGLANMLVADRCSVVELSPSGAGATRLQLAYWSLARTCGHRFAVVTHAAGRHCEQFEVDVDRTRAEVERLLADPEDRAVRPARAGSGKGGRPGA